MIKQHKVVSALPTPLEADSIYFVRVGSGFDVVVTNGVGTIVPYDLNVKLALLNKAASGVNGDITSLTAIQKIDMQGILNMAPAVTVASAATVDMGAAAVTSNNAVVTGTTAITSLGSTAKVGTERRIRFTGVLTLTHSANLILPGAASITTAVDDLATFECQASGVWRCTQYFRGPGARSVVDSGEAGRQVLTRATTADIKTYLGLGNVNNTADADKPVSIAAQTALNNKMNTAYTTTVDATSDLDSMKSPGPYGSLVGTNNAHHPAPGTYVFIFNLVYGASLCQIAYPYGVSDSGVIYYRTFYAGNSGFNGWRKLLNSSDLVTTLSDPTLGRVATVGYMGVGAGSIYITDLAAIRASGFHAWSSPTSAIGGVLPYANIITVRYGADNNWMSQLALSVGGNEILYSCAHSSPANSSPWTRLISSRNVTLPVSSDINTSGGILEFGSNASGIYWKFANGMLVCIVKFTGYTQNTAKSVSWPHAFSAEPVVECNVVPFGYWNYNYSYYGTQSLAWFNTAEATTSANSVLIMGTGRWY